jgi:hypothetical protein
MTAAGSAPLNETGLDGFKRVTFSDGNVITYNTNTHDLVRDNEGNWILQVKRTSPPANTVIPL